MNTRHHTLSRFSISLGSWPISDQNGGQKEFMCQYCSFTKIELKSRPIGDFYCQSGQRALPRLETLIENLEAENET